MTNQKAYLLDTDTVIYWLKNKFPAIDKKIKSIDEDQVFISSISMAELYFGAFNSAQKEDNKKLIDDLQGRVNVLYFDENAAMCFGETKADLKTKGRIISDSDLFIAGIAISNELILVTNNIKHFDRIKDLTVENWAVE